MLTVFMYLKYRNYNLKILKKICFSINSSVQSLSYVQLLVTP